MIQGFIAYAHADEGLRKELDKHLASLKHRGVVELWNDRRIDAGEEWAHAIDANLRAAKVILLLVSSDFIASEYCYDVEMREALRRHGAEEAVVIPVILRSCDWQELPFGKLQAATRDGRPIVKYPSLDDGFLEVVRSVNTAAQRISTQAERPTAEASDSRIRKFDSPVRVEAAHRSSNMQVKKTFTDHDRDAFRFEAFEYIAKYFENSLTELEARNPQLKYQFRQRDANSFEAAIYEGGAQAAKCGIWLGQDRVRDLAYGHEGLGAGNNYTESMSVADDGYMLGLKLLGISSYMRGEKPEFLTLEGAAEYYWSMFIRPLQDT